MIINFMDEKIYYFTAINRGQVKIVDGDKIILHFNNELKSRIKPRMIFKTQRLYSYDSDTDDLDELINTKIDDILNYEYHVEKDSTSIDKKKEKYSKNLNDNIKGLKIGIPKEYRVDNMPK